MKTFAKILGGFILLIIAVIVGLNIYFSGDRLKQTVMPYLNEAVGREVQVETISLSFFSTFPHPGLTVRQMNVPGETPADTLLTLDELVAGAKLLPLLRNEISITEIQLNNPKFTYRIYEDSTTNLDFLLQEDEEVLEEETETYSLDIPYFTVSSGTFGYEDRTSGTTIRMDRFDADISLRYSDLIQSSVEIELGGLSANINGTQYIENLPLSLSETSTIDLENETITLESGTFAIRGLALDLTGTIAGWNSGTPSVDLQFASSSDNFGELLGLAPPGFDEQLQDLETRGSLSISGTLSGEVGGETLPSFSVNMGVADGYLRNPDLPQPVENIVIRAEATNKLLTINNLEATAGSNFIRASGRLERPLDPDGLFDLELAGNIDLGTVESFYSLEVLDIEQMAGLLNLTVTASGQLDNTEEASFDAGLELTEGSIKYASVPQPVDRIDILARATQERATIDRFELNAGQNRITLNGIVDRPLEEINRTVDLQTDLFFDLATIKNFYPIDEDTLNVRGLLTARASLSGRAQEITQAVQSGILTLENGFIDYERLGRPIENITLSSSMRGDVLTIENAGFRSGENDLSLSGTVTDYLGDNPVLNLQVEGNGDFAEIQNYYDLSPTINTLTGRAALNLTVEGSIGNPAEMLFNGDLAVSNLMMDGDSLVQPVRNLNGELTLTPSSADLTGLRFELGSSDLSLSGSLQNYMEYVKAGEDRETTPSLTGRMQSSLFNLDELIDWEDDEELPAILIELPDLNSSVTASIDTLIVTGVAMRNLEARASTSPSRIALEQASVEMFGGSATGSFTWDVPRPDRTNLRFNGELSNIGTSAFFNEYQLLGPESTFHEHITGSFSAVVEYYTEIDTYLEPIIPTTRMNGSFTLTESRIEGLPIQEQLASLLNADDLRRVDIDESETLFSVNNSVLTIENLQLTSEDMGAEMSGTRHLINNRVDYRLQVYLPPRFRNGIASVISAQGVEALTQENGTILLPLRVTGTQENPRLEPDQDVIRPIIQEMVRREAGNVLRNLFGQ